MAQYLVPALIGAGLFVLGWFQYRHVRRSRSWTAVSGTIVTARVASEISSGDDDSADSVSYFPAIEYEYRAGEHVLRGSRIAFTGRTYPTANGAEKALLAFRVGSPVQVYYDPAAPHEAVLQRKAPGGVLLMVIGAVIVVLGVAAMLVR